MRDELTWTVAIMTTVFLCLLLSPLVLVAAILTNWLDT